MTYSDLIEYLLAIPKKDLDKTQLRVEVRGSFHQIYSIKTNMHGLKKPHIVMLAAHEKHGYKIYSIKNIKSLVKAYVVNYYEPRNDWELTYHYDSADKFYSLKEARKVLKMMNSKGYKIVSRKI